MRIVERACPFCGSALALEHVALRPKPAQRLGRAAVFAFGAAVAASSAGCATSTTPAEDGGTDAYYGLGGDVYGAPPHDTGPIDAGDDAVAIAAYGGPPIDAALDDAAQADDADLPDSGTAALYGAPPVPPPPDGR